MVDIQGEDVSSYQGDFTPNPAVKFAWVKSSEGQAGRDPRYTAHVNAYQRAGIPWGPYHFLRPKGAASDQARFWRAVAGPLGPGNLRPLADIEVPGFDPTWLRAFLDTAQQEFGARPIIYDSLGTLSYIRGLEDYDLDVAAYRKTEPSLAGGFHLVGWQNSNHGPDGGDSQITHDLSRLLIGGSSIPPEVHPMSGSPRVALVPIGTGLVAYFADGGAWCSDGTGHTAADWSCHDAVAARGGTVTAACKLGDGIAVLSSDGTIDTRFAAPVGSAV